MTAGGSIAQTDALFNFCEPVPLRRSLSGTAGSYVVSAAYGSSSVVVVVVVVARSATCCPETEADAEEVLPE